MPEPHSSPRTTVRAGYDAIAEAYLAWGSRVVGDPRERFVDDLAARLPDGARVLDLGCGAGVPSTRRLAERFDVVGVDVSARQIELARVNVPGTTFICADLTDLQFEEGTFAAVTALYSVSHVPRAEHGVLFGRIASWLAPGGLFPRVARQPGQPRLDRRVARCADVLQQLRRPHKPWTRRRCRPRAGPC